MPPAESGTEQVVIADSADPPDVLQDLVKSVDLLARKLAGISVAPLVKSGELETDKYLKLVSQVDDEDSLLASVDDCVRHFDFLVLVVGMFPRTVPADDFFVAVFQRAYVLTSGKLLDSKTEHGKLKQAARLAERGRTLVQHMRYMKRSNPRSKNALIKQLKDMIVITPSPQKSKTKRKLQSELDLELARGEQCNVAEMPAAEEFEPQPSDEIKAEECDPQPSVETATDNEDPELPDNLDPEVANALWGLVRVLPWNFDLSQDPSTWPENFDDWVIWEEVDWSELAPKLQPLFAIFKNRHSSQESGAPYLKHKQYSPMQSKVHKYL